MSFLQRTPFFRLLLPLITGIVFFQYVELPVFALGLLAFLSVVFIFIFLLVKNAALQYKLRWLFGAGVFLLLATGGYSLSSYVSLKSAFSHPNQKSLFLVELSSAPVIKTKSVRCEVNLLTVFQHNTAQSATGKAILFLQKDTLATQLRYGDRVLARVEFNKPMGAVNPDGFDYAAYLKRQGILATGYVSAYSWRKTDFKPDFSFKRLANLTRDELLKIYSKFNIHNNEFAVLAALTLGYTDDLDPDLRASYSATGAMHILSVSGLHVGIVYVVIAFLLSFMNRSNRLRLIKTILIVVFLWVYAFLTGLSPSVVRSALMFSFVAIGASLERRSQIYNTIFMSAFFMLLINPNFLFNVGFQLSYAAVLSIVFFQKPFSSLLPLQNKLLRWVRDLVAVSLAAQLGTLAFTLYYFQQFPNYFLLTNLVAIPLSTMVIYLAMGLMAVSFVPFLSDIVAFLLKWTTWLLNASIQAIEDLPGSVSVLSLEVNQMWLMVLAILLLSSYFYYKKYTLLFLSLFSILLIASISLFIKVESLADQKLIVYSAGKSTHVNIIDQGRNYAFTSDSAALKKIATSFWRKNNIQSPMYFELNQFSNHKSIGFTTKRILIAEEKMWKYKAMGEPLAIDYLIVGNRLKPNIKNLLENIKPRLIVVDASISEWYTERIKENCLLHNIGFYSIAQHGAFVLDVTD